MSFARRERQRPASPMDPGGSTTSGGGRSANRRKVERSLPLLLVALVFLSSGYFLADNSDVGRALPSSSRGSAPTIVHTGSPLSLSAAKVADDAAYVRYMLMQREGEEDDPRRSPPSPGPLRVLALGGSVTWGGGECVDSPQEQAYPHVLGKMLDGWWGQRPRVTVRGTKIPSTRDAEAMPTVVHNLALRGSGSFFPSMCITSMVRDRLRQEGEALAEGNMRKNTEDDDDEEGEPDYDVVLLEFSLNGVQGLRMLLWRLRRRYPNAVLLYVHLRGTAEEGRDNENGGSKSVERIATLMREVGGTVWDLHNHRQISSLSPSLDQSMYCSDHWHLSPAGHDRVAHGLFKALTAAAVRPSETVGLRPPKKSTFFNNMHPFPFASQPDLGTWGLGDVCHLWYHTRQMPPDVKASGGRMNLFRPDQRKFAYEVPMEDNEAAVLELSVAHDEGGREFRIPRKVKQEGVPVYLSHMTYGAPGYYPAVDVEFTERTSSSPPVKAQRRTGAANGDGKEARTRTRIDPSKTKDGQEQRQAGLHLTEMSEVGRARLDGDRSTVKVRIFTASDTNADTESEQRLEPFRIVGLSACGACVEMGFDEYADKGMRRCRKEKCFL